MFLARPVILAGMSLFLATTHSLAGGGDDKVAGLNVKRAVFMTEEGRYELEKLSKRLEPKQKALKDMNAEIENLRQPSTLKHPLWATRIAPTSKARSK